MVCVAHVAVLLSRFGFTVLLFLLRSLVSMNFTVVYIYTAEVRPFSAAGVGSSVLVLVVLVSLERLFLLTRCIPLWPALWGWVSARRSVGSEE